VNVHRKPKKRLAARTALALGVPGQSDLTWSLDFMSDSLSNGRAIRTLNIMDDYNREALWIEVDTSLPAERVVRVLESLLLWRASPKQIRMDNGPELISKRLENWAQEKQIELLHIQPGKPAQNAYIERFNRTYRDEVLDAYLFDDLEEVRLITERWLEEYNTIRPHEALQGLSPRQYEIQNA
jgi:putative transposase